MAWQRLALLVSLRQRPPAMQFGSFLPPLDVPLASVLSLPFFGDSYGKCDPHIIFGLQAATRQLPSGFSPSCK